MLTITRSTRGIELARTVYLTFDVEDFINNDSTIALREILKLLDAKELEGLFFITGHVAEKLEEFPDIIDMLSHHQIGFHSSSHSVRPTIFEYTDLPNYQEAVEAVLRRETSHIDPLTGGVSGKGGIALLRSIFSAKQVVAFRAPGLCWTPPLIEGLRKLGMLFDFSAYLSRDPVIFRGTTFYPYPFLTVQPEGKRLNLRTYCEISRLFVTRRTTVIDIHPQSLVNEAFWDSTFWTGNPTKLSSAKEKTQKEQKKTIIEFRIFLEWIATLRNLGIKVTPPLRRAGRSIQPTIGLAEKSYERSMGWPMRFFSYYPIHIHRHFMQFFNT